MNRNSRSINCIGWKLCPYRTSKTVPPGGHANTTSDTFAARNSTGFLTTTVDRGVTVGVAKTTDPPRLEQCTRSWTSFLISFKTPSVTRMASGKSVAFPLRETHLSWGPSPAPSTTLFYSKILHRMSMFRRHHRTKTTHVSLVPPNEKMQGDVNPSKHSTIDRCQPMHAIH